MTTDTTEKQKLLREYYEQFYAKKLDNLEEMDKFLETYNLPWLNQEETDKMNRSITSSEIELINLKTPSKQKSMTGQLHMGILSNI